MNNSEKFIQTFNGMYSIELWTMSKEEYCKWVREEYKEQTNTAEWVELGDFYKCSECGTIHCCTGNYCMNCGSRMKGIKECD